MDILTVPAIAALVFTMMESIAGLIPAKVKPPLSLALGALWSCAAFFSVHGSYPSLMVAVAIGMTAGAAASGLDSYRSTYQATGPTLAAQPPKAIPPPAVQPVAPV